MQPCMERQVTQMETYKLFIRSMKVMGDRLFIYLAAILGMSVGMSLFFVMSSLLMKSVVDIAQTGEYHKMAVTIGGIVVVSVISLLVYRISTIRYNVEAKRVYGKLSEAMLDTEMQLPYTYYEKHHSGEIVSKVSYDLTGMGNIYGSRFRRVIMPFIQVIVMLIPMLALCWQLTLCLVAVNCVMIGIDMLLVDPMHKVSKELSGINGRMTSRLSDLLQGMEQVRMYEAGQRTVEEFRMENEKYAKKSGKKIIYISCLESIDRGFELLCSLVFLLLGIYFVQSGFTTLGSVAAIYTMYGVFSAQFLQMGKYVPELVGCLANAKHIFDFLDETREPENWYCDKISEKETEQVENIIEIDSITFSYEEDRKVIENFSLAVKQGECVAITGPSGCGKTTLSKLLLGLYPMERGDIRICGLSMREHALFDIRKQIAYVPQEPYLFQGTIRDNIMTGSLNASEAEMIEAAKQANAHEFIMSFEQGYDTLVGERGNNLSGGQRQRIAIARAILKNAPIILLDEATSALDNESEQLVNEAMKNLQGRKTIIMIAHRPSTIQLADRVCEM